MSTNHSFRYFRVILALIMGGIIAASNFLYSYPLGQWLTWGAFSYPFTFLVTDLTNRHLGPNEARKIVGFGFATAVPLSFVLAGGRIAIASGAAYLVAQFIDIWIFSRLRDTTWWRAPLISTTIASLIDSSLFFSIAFAYTGLPWIQFAVGDQAIKWLLALLLLPVYYALIRRSRLPAFQ